MSMDYELNANPKGRSYVVTLLLAFFLGGFGIHRFYTGYILIGIVQLLTCGGCGLWAIIDLIAIALNKYNDAQGKELEDPNPGCGMIVMIMIIISFILGGLKSVLTMYGSSS